MSVKTMLRDEIKDQLEYLNEMEVGSDEYKATVDGITKLVDRLNEIEKMEIESLEKAESRDIETDLKLKQMADDKRDRFVKNCLTGVSIATGVGVSVWGTIMAMKFEKEDSFTSMVGRGWVNKITSFLKK